MAGVLFFSQTCNIFCLLPRSTWDTWIVESHGIFFFLSFCPVFFLSLVPIKRHKTVIIIFLGCSAHCDPGYSTQFMHIKQKLGAKFFQLKFPEAFYSYLMPIIPYPILTQLTQQKKKRTQCAKISKPVTEEVEIGDWKNSFSSIFIQARNFQVLLCVFANLCTRKEQLFKLFKLYSLNEEI